MSDIKGIGQSPALMPTKNGQVTSGQKSRSRSPNATVVGGFDKIELSTAAKALSKTASKILGSDGDDRLVNLRPLLDQTASETQAGLYRELLSKDLAQG
ncbi:MAG: hypothetical protein P4L69_18980 [Desulfosporosinus sp.]|nr:hypothetical protein [Desulfosporosinus sp.]